MSSKIDLDNITEEALLDLKICKLPITIKQMWLDECVQTLYDELAQKEIVFRPVCYLADEWLTPYGEPCIGIPFYLAHPTLIRLEKKYMIDAEGETKPWCMKLLRHETGHALCYAYGFHKRKKWATMFGEPSREYKDYYKFRPYSKSFVRHLEGYYAQYHPEEDFVETFAVWLTPGLDWQEKYKDWKALQKLQYVDKLMQGIKEKKPLVTNALKHWRLATLKITLRNHYRKKLKFWAEEFPDFYDPSLRKIFHEGGPDDKKCLKAYQLIKNCEREILSNVARFTGEHKYIVGNILRNIQKRARLLKLCVGENEQKDLISLTSYVTSLCMNYRYTGRYRGDRGKHV